VDAGGYAVFSAVERSGFFSIELTIDIQNFRQRRQTASVAGAIVHHFDVVGDAIPLNVQRLTNVFAGEVAAVGSR